MPRLTHVLTGTVVSVDDATAARLGSAYTPVDEPKRESTPDKKPGTVRRAPASKK